MHAGCRGVTQSELSAMHHATTHNMTLITNAVIGASNTFIT